MAYNSVPKLELSCEAQTISLGFAICVLVVSFIYIFSWNYERSTMEGVKLRVIGMFFASMASVTLLQFTGYLEVDDMIPSFTLYSYDEFIHTMLIPLGITITFYCGPILEKMVHGTLFQTTIPLTIEEKFRNFVFGPVMEEFTYRFLMINLLGKCFGTKVTLNLAAFFFSISHVHHHYVQMLRSGSCDWGNFGRHVLSTYAFGLYSAVIYMKIKSILVVTLIHSFSNYMGLPRADRIMKKQYLCVATIFGLFTSIILLFLFIYM